jgi:hypothetical protein
MQLLCFKKQNYYSRKSIKCRWSCNFRFRNVSKLIEIGLSEEVDGKLKGIMLAIHASCVKYGSDTNGYVDYVKGANIAGFVKVADAMLAQGVV